MAPFSKGESPGTDAYLDVIASTRLLYLSEGRFGRMNDPGVPVDALPTTGEIGGFATPYDRLEK